MATQERYEASKRIFYMDNYKAFLRSLKLWPLSCFWKETANSKTQEKCLLPEVILLASVVIISCQIYCHKMVSPEPK